MEAVLDSISLNHLLRTPKKVQKGQSKEVRFETSLDEPIRNGAIFLVVDDAGGLIDEWRDTCGNERVQVVVNYWESFGAIKAIKNIPNFRNDHWNALRQLGFTDTIDKLILRLAHATADRMVVSDDSDFWDPSIPGNRGDINSPVCRYCRENLNIAILILADFLFDLINE